MEIQRTNHLLILACTVASALNFLKNRQGCGTSPHTQSPAFSGIAPQHFIPRGVNTAASE